MYTIMIGHLRSSFDRKIIISLIFLNPRGALWFFYLSVKNSFLYHNFHQTLDEYFFNSPFWYFFLWSIYFSRKSSSRFNVGGTRQRGNVISDRESRGHYPLSQHGQYYRPWGHGARKCDSCATVPMETYDRIHTPLLGLLQEGAVTRGSRSSTNIDATRRRGTPRVWRTVFRVTRRDHHRRNSGLSFRLTRNTVLALFHSQKSLSPPRDNGTLCMGGSRLIVETRSRFIEVISNCLRGTQKCFHSRKSQFYLVR